MNQNRSDVQHELTLAVAGVLFLFSLIAIPFFFSTEAETWVWEGYYLLLYQEADKPVEPYLEEGGITDFLSSGNVEVSYNTVPGISTLPLSRLAGQFDPVDPRWDAYMKKVPGYFRCFRGDATWKLLYIPRSVSIYRMKRMLRSALAGFDGEWVLDGYQTQPYLLKGAVLAILAVGIGIFIRIRIRWHLAGLLPIFLMFWVGDSYAMIGALLLVLAWLLVCIPFSACLIGAQKPISGFIRVHGRRLRLSFFSVIPTLLLAIPASNRLDLLLLYLCVLTGEFCFFVFMLRVEKIRARNRVHLLFQPKYLRTESGRIGSEAFRLSTAAVLLILFLPGIVNMGQPLSDLKLPHPKELSTGEEDMSLETLTTLATLSGPDALPNLADYATHLAFQEGFMYNRAYALPKNGEILAVTRYRKEDGRVVENVQTVTVYSDVWLAEHFSRANPRGIERLLIDQHHPVMVTWAIPEFFRIYIPLWIRLIICGTVLSPFLLSEMLALSRSDGNKSWLLARRQQQSA